MMLKTIIKLVYKANRLPCESRNCIVSDLSLLSGKSTTYRVEPLERKFARMGGERGADHLRHTNIEPTVGNLLLLSRCGESLHSILTKASLVTPLQIHAKVPSNQHRRSASGPRIQARSRFLRLPQAWQWIHILSRFI